MESGGTKHVVSGRITLTSFVSTVNIDNNYILFSNSSDYLIFPIYDSPCDHDIVN